MAGLSATVAVILLADADVLIDYRDADLGVLGLTARHIAPVAVLAPVLAQVRGLPRSACERVGLRVVTPVTRELLDAGRLAGRIGFEDALGVVVAARRGWAVVSNDRAVCSACDERGVPSRRGLSLMVELAAVGVLAKPEARRVARAIHLANPAHIHAGVLEEFERLLGAGDAGGEEDPSGA